MKKLLLVLSTLLMWINICRAVDTSPHFHGDGSGLTNLNPANMAGVVTNGSAQVTLSGTFSGNGSNLTNTYNFLGTVGVYPSNNIPPSIATNAMRWFTPNDGSNYVQLAINSLSYPSAYRNYVGGGKVVVYGTNFTPVTLTNIQNAGATNPAASLFMESPSFSVGALIGETNPVIKFWCSNASAAFGMKNLIISSTNDQTNFMVIIGPSASRVWVEDNCIAPWGWLQSNTPSLSPASYGNPVTVANLVGIDANISIADWVSFEGNSFCGLATGIHWHVDHGSAINNFFTDCGRNITKWTSASVYSLGCAVVLEHTGNNDMLFLNSHFYGGNNSYFLDFNYNGNNAFETGSYGPEAVLENDGYEANEGGMLIMTNSGITCVNAHSDDGDNIPGQITLNYVTNGPPITDPNDSTSMIPSGPFAVEGVPPAGLVRFQWFDFTGWYEIGPGNCGFQTSPLVWDNGGTFWHDESGKGIGLNGSGVIQGNGSGLTNLNPASINGGPVTTNGETNGSVPGFAIAGNATVTSNLTAENGNFGNGIVGYGQITNNGSGPVLSNFIAIGANNWSITQTGLTPNLVISGNGDGVGIAAGDTLTVPSGLATTPLNAANLASGTVPSNTLNGVNGAGLTNLHLNTNTLGATNFAIPLVAGTRYTNTGTKILMLNWTETNNNAIENWQLWHSNSVGQVLWMSGYNGAATSESNSGNFLMSPGDVFFYSNLATAVVGISNYGQVFP